MTVTDDYDVPRTYTLAKIAGRSKVTALADGPAVTPYGPDSAIRWQYDNQLNLEEVEYAGGTADSPMNTVHRFENFGCPGQPRHGHLRLGHP